jgi:hypothetical protein
MLPTREVGIRLLVSPQSLASNGGAMAMERLTMRNLREILRQKLALKQSHRVAARAAGVSAGTVAMAATRAKVLGLTWDDVRALDDCALDTRMYGPVCGCRSGRPLPDLSYVHLELRRPGVTLQLLRRYLERHPTTGYPLPRSELPRFAMRAE